MGNPSFFLEPPPAFFPPISLNRPFFLVPLRGKSFSSCSRHAPPTVFRSHAEEKSTDGSLYLSGKVGADLLLFSWLPYPFFPGRGRFLLRAVSRWFFSLDCCEHFVARFNPSLPAKRPFPAPFSSFGAISFMGSWVVKYDLLHSSVCLEDSTERSPFFSSLLVPCPFPFPNEFLFAIDKLGLLPCVTFFSVPAQKTGPPFFLS